MSHDAFTAHGSDRATSEPLRISASELARRADCDEETVERLAGAGVLQRAVDGTFAQGDEHRIRLVHAFEGAGVPISVLSHAVRTGKLSFAQYDQLHAGGGEPSGRTYSQLRADLGPRAALLERLLADLGLPQPEPGGRFRRDEEELLLEVLGIVEGIPQRDFALRLTRLLGESARRVAMAALDVYAQAVEQDRRETGDLPPEETYERFLAPWAGLARLAPQLSGWLTARQLSAAIDAYSVSATEQYLELEGFVAPRPSLQPAVAFADLSGFTWLAEREGDDRAAGVAMHLGTVANEVASGHGGHLVKLLGDGVLMRFPGAESAVLASLDLLARLPAGGLPPGHVGIDSGPLVMREGDVFGRTVNRAARLADHAAPAEILVTDSVVADLPPGRFRVEHLGDLDLRGVPHPVTAARISGGDGAAGDESGGVAVPSRPPGPDALSPLVSRPKPDAGGDPP
jgi:adenylate cyclase